MGSRYRRRSRRLWRGFTLLELMLVVAIVGVLAAVATPNIYGTVKRRQAEGQILEVQNVLLRARNRARNAVCVMHITVNADHLLVGPDASDPSLDCQGLQSVPYEIGSLISVAQFTVSGTATQPFVLNSDGGTDYDTRGILAITDTVSGKVTRYEVWPATGYVQEVP